jgi:uncharacterized protein YjiS (DUF1127 family)
LQRSNLAKHGLGRERFPYASFVEAENRRAVNQKDTAMKMFTRFLRARRVYWSVLQELSAYSDRELHDIGIDRADIHEIARLASREEA